MLDDQNFTESDLRLMFHACRKYQKTLLKSANVDEYYQLNDILTKLQPVAYSSAFKVSMNGEDSPWDSE